MNIIELLALSQKHAASDLHISAGLPPMIRLDGEMQRLNLPALSSDAVLAMIHSAMDKQQRKRYESELEVDFAFETQDSVRFRVNAFNQSRGPAAVFRSIPASVLSLEALGAPHIFGELAMKPHGLVLLTGPTGSGKTTTLAAMIDHINHQKSAHILTIEDPIEFGHQSVKSLINQRELDKHTHSFANALKSALREDPDVILVGELRDLETIRLAMTAAETGHLVLATVHTRSAAKTINRIVDVFPAAEKALIRSMLSESIEAVISQTLIKKIGGGRIAAHEIMLATPAIRNLIREDKTAQMYSMIQTGKSDGMRTLDQCLLALVRKRTITIKDARYLAVDKTLFRLG